MGAGKMRFGRLRAGFPQIIENARLELVTEVTSPIRRSSFIFLEKRLGDGFEGHNLCNSRRPVGLRPGPRANGVRMKPRRSRIRRIYRQITRRSATRRQWQQISQLRPQGAIGHPTENCPSHSHARATPVIEEIRDFQVTEWRPDTTSFQPHEAADEQSASDRPGRSALGAVAALAISLFLLACAYSGFAGYMHALNNRLAWIGVVGAAGCLVAAGAGVALCASKSQRHYSGRLLGVAAVFLASLYGVLLISATLR